MPQHLGQAHDREFGSVVPGIEPGGTHRIAADATKLRIGITQPQLLDQACA